MPPEFRRPYPVPEELKKPHAALCLATAGGDPCFCDLADEAMRQAMEKLENNRW